MTWPRQSRRRPKLRIEAELGNQLDSGEALWESHALTPHACGSPLPSAPRGADRVPYATSSQSRRTSGALRRSAGVPSNTIWPWPMT